MYVSEVARMGVSHRYTNNISISILIVIYIVIDNNISISMELVREEVLLQLIGIVRRLQP